MASDFARVQTQDRLQRLVDCLNQVNDSAGEDEVHDLRVSIRRFKAALRVFRPEFAPRKAKKIRRSLDPVMQSAGIVRDRDVIVKLALKSEREPSEIVAALREQRADEATKLGTSVGKLLRKDPLGKWAKRLGL